MNPGERDPGHCLEAAVAQRGRLVGGPPPLLGLGARGGVVVVRFDLVGGMVVGGYSWLTLSRAAGPSCAQPLPAQYPRSGCACPSGILSGERAAVYGGARLQSTANPSTQQLFEQ